MIPPMSINRYPGNTLEGMLARKFVSMILGCEDHVISLELIQPVINGTRDLMRAAGWPALYQHNFLLQLKSDLTELTRGHPVTRQFIQMLEIETEFD